VEAVIDKDRAGAVLARELDADTLIIATDTDAVYTDWGNPDARAVSHAHPDALLTLDLPAGSMGPKAEAAADFVHATGRDCVIGALAELPMLLAGRAGTRVTMSADGITLR
jgi:carbamate kinase